MLPDLVKKGAARAGKVTRYDNRVIVTRIDSECSSSQWSLNVLRDPLVELTDKAYGNVGGNAFLSPTDN